MNTQEVEALARVLKSARPIPGTPGHRDYEVSKNQRTQWAYDCTRIGDFVVSRTEGVTLSDFVIMCGVREGRRHD